MQILWHSDALWLKWNHGELDKREKIAVEDYFGSAISRPVYKCLFVSKLSCARKKKWTAERGLVSSNTTSFKKFRKMEIWTTTQTNWQGTSRLNLACHVAKVDIFTLPCV